MSINQLNTEIITLNKHIASLQAKYASEKKVESDKRVRIVSIQSSINKNTSVSTVNSKLKQISQLEKEIAQSATKQANLTKEIANKQKILSDKTASLSKEQVKEAKKQQEEQKKLHINYERQIASLQSKIKMQSRVENSNTSHNLYEQNNSVKYDVFISHATEDKEDFVDELVQELQQLDIKVWYDKICIKWGESLRSKIDEGLRNSQFGIVVLSQAYICKGWTQYELEGLFNIEMTNGKTILPIWHNITKSQVQQFSPTIAGRLAMNTTMQTPNEIAHELAQILNDNNE